MREVRQNNNCRKCGENKYSCECNSYFNCLFDGDVIQKEAANIHMKGSISYLERLRVKWLMEKYYTIGYRDGEV